MNRREACKISIKTFAAAGILCSPLMMFPSCKEDDKRSAPTGILSREQYEVLNILSDIMIPASDTPGALDVGVPEKVEIYIRNFLSPPNQQQIAMGLDKVNLLSQRMYRESLWAIEPQEQMEVMAALSRSAEQSTNKSNHLFFSLRGMIVTAYFQSEIIAREVLIYDPIPQAYRGCIPFDEIGGQWSL